MFTGIVTHRGRLVAVAPSEGGMHRLVVRPETPMTEVALGASIANDGVCLTVAAFEDDAFAFDVVPETLRKTTLGDRAVGDLVNLERSLRLGDEMGGHQVQGHVEGVARVVAFDREGEDVRLALAVGDDLRGALIPKGSIALDGVSLTVGEVWEDDGEERFSVYLVPHTLEVTGLGALQPGARVNVEPDVLGRWVEHHVRRLLGSADDGGVEGGAS